MSMKIALRHGSRNPLWGCQKRYVSPNLQNEVGRQASRSKMKRRSSNRRLGLKILQAFVTERTKHLPEGAQKFSRLRWGVRGQPGMGMLEAASRMGLPLAEAVKIETEVRDLLQLPIPPLDDAEDNVPENGLLATFIVSPEITIVSEVVSDRLMQELVKFPALLHKLHHRKFEEIIAYLFDDFGYDVELTKRTRDGGRDIIAVRNGEVSVRFLIECKHPRQGNLVGVGPVRELYAVKVDERATKALLATSSYFTRDALIFAERHEWELELRDFEGVMEWLRMATVGGQPMAPKVNAAQPPLPPDDRLRRPRGEASKRYTPAP